MKEVSPSVQELLSMAEALYQETRDLSRDGAVSVIAHRLLEAYHHGGTNALDAMKQSLEHASAQ